MAFVIVATWVARVGSEARIAEVLRQLAKTSREEPGCLSYQVLVANRDPCRFVIYEAYRDRAACETHRASPHFRSLLERAGSDLHSRRAEDYTPLDSPGDEVGDDQRRDLYACDDSGFKCSSALGELLPQSATDVRTPADSAILRRGRIPDAQTALPVPKAAFQGLGGPIHLATAGESPLLLEQAGVYLAFSRDKSAGMAGRERIFARVEEARADVASLIGCVPDEVGFPLNVAQAVSSVARTLDSPGRNVVAAQWEYPSGLYPFITGTGFEVRTVRNGQYSGTAEDFAPLVDDRTAVIIVSLVSYFTGELVDLGTFRALADSVGAALLVDASHALGAAHFDPTLADFLFSCGYKWLLGAHGAGVAYCNSQRQPGWLPLESGWRSAAWVPARQRDLRVQKHPDGRRFELGNPAALPVLMAGAGARFLGRVGTREIHAHLLTLSDAMVAGLHAAGIPLLTPAERERRLGIVAFEVEDVGWWRTRLESDGILAWVSDGRVRLSAHLFNPLEDVEAAVHRVTVAWPDRPR